MDKKLKFIYDLTKHVPHGNKTFFQHLYNTSVVVKNIFPKKQYLIDAALYHAVYGSCYFKFNLDLDRKVIKNLIGEKSENLVYTYCNLDNRTTKILEHKFNYELQKDLYILEYANFLDQLNQYSLDKFKQLKENLLKYYGINMEHNPLNDKIHVLDNKLTRAQLSHIHTYCLRSNYKLQQLSDISSYEKDVRFSCLLKKSEVYDTGIVPTLDQVCREYNLKLYLKEYYINYYSQIFYAHRHTDFNFDGCVSILIFCNKYWDESWGGELKIYDDSDPLINKVIDFVPGRIILFDSKIEHKVLPLTPYAKSDRFSIAIKGYVNPEYLIESDFESLIEIGVA